MTLNNPKPSFQGQAILYFKRLCIFGPKGAIQIRYYYYYYYYYYYLTLNISEMAKDTVIVTMEGE